MVQSTAPISRDGHTLLLDYINDLWSTSTGFYSSELLPKFWAIDRAYYTYKEVSKKQGKDAALTACSNILTRNAITLPIAVSDADTAVSSLADTFLTGNPIFGVVAPPDQMQIIPAWESLFQYYSKVGDWQTELYNCFSSGIRYNMPIVEIDWRLHYEFNSVDSLTTVQRQANMAPLTMGVAAMRAPDPYNLIWDTRVRPSRLSAEGTHAGYNEILSRVQLKSYIAAISMDENRKKYTMNLKEAYETTFPATYWNWKPPVSKFVNPDQHDTNWAEWAMNEERAIQGEGMRFKNTQDLFLVTKLYLQLIPSEYKINTSYDKTPRVYKAVIINRRYIVYLEPIFTPFNTLPIFLGDLQDDFFDYQSMSEVEKLFPYQDIATELMNTRLQSSARALGDRAIYDPNYFNQGDITTTEAAAKIPLKMSLRLDQKTIDQVYRPQPYDHSSTAGVMGDIEAMMGFARMQSGRNEFQQGQNRKGNRTLGEFQTVMGESEVRQLRIPLRIEAMIMNPLKAHLKSLIYQNVDKIDLLNTRTRKLISIDPTELRQTLIDFKMTTGLANKSMAVNPELLITGLQTLQANPELAAKYDVAEWFAYIMTMGGVPDVDQFIREPNPEQGSAAQPGVPDQAEEANSQPSPQAAGPSPQAPQAPQAE